MGAGAFLDFSASAASFAMRRYLGSRLSQKSSSFRNSAFRTGEVISSVFSRPIPEPSTGVPSASNFPVVATACSNFPDMAARKTVAVTSPSVLRADSLARISPMALSVVVDGSRTMVAKRLRQSVVFSASSDQPDALASFGKASSGQTWPTSIRTSGLDFAKATSSCTSEPTEGPFSAFLLVGAAPLQYAGMRTILINISGIVRRINEV